MRFYRLRRSCHACRAFASPKTSHNPSTGKSGCSSVAGWPNARAPLRPRDIRCAPRLPSSRASPFASNHRPEINSRSASFCAGRQRSTPGSGENVAFTSLITVAFSTFASRVAGSTSAISRRQKLDNFQPRARHQIVRSADHELQILSVRIAAAPFDTHFSPGSSFLDAALDAPSSHSFRLPPKAACLLKIHCVVWSSSVRNGSVITVRSNQKCTLVIGEVLMCRNPSSGAPMFRHRCWHHARAERHAAPPRCTHPLRFPSHLQAPRQRIGRP